MQKKVTVMALAAVVTLVLAMPVAAQATDVGPLVSNTSVGTAGLFKNDVDFLVNYHKYANVLTGDAKYFGFVTGRTDFGGSADLGFATSLSNIYLGVWYRGNIVSLDNATETHAITPVWNDSLGIVEQTQERTSYSQAQFLRSANKFEFLIGVAGHGIKVGFFESYLVDQNLAVAGRDIIVTDYMDGRKEYTAAPVDYQQSRGYLKPYIGWGSNFSVAGMNLMPFVDLAFQINDDKLVDNYRSYTEVNGKKQNIVGVVGAGNNSGVMRPIIGVGAKLDLAKKNTIASQVQLKYDLNLDVYNNDYSATGLSGDAVPGTVSWRNSTGMTEAYVNRVTNYADRTETITDITLAITEPTALNNKITPGYQIIGEPFENFKIGLLATVPISFNFTSSNSYTRRIQKEVVKYNMGNLGYVREEETLTYANQKREQSVFGLDLNLYLGIQYKLVPDRLTFNTGISATPLSYSRTETKQTPNNANIHTVKRTEDDGSVTTNTKDVTPLNQPDQVTVTDSWAQWKASISGGLVFYFSPKIALDLAMAADFGTDTFVLDLARLNVILTLKF
jgi:hypothetical protein